MKQDIEETNDLLLSVTEMGCVDYHKDKDYACLQLTSLMQESDELKNFILGSVCHFFARQTPESQRRLFNNMRKTSDDFRKVYVEMEKKLSRIKSDA